MSKNMAPQTSKGIAPGMKYDSGKPRFDLLRTGCARSLEGVARVLTFGAQKYAAHSWRNVEDGFNRYLAALDRHINALAIHGPQARDAESGLLHIDHAACNALFIAELVREHNPEVNE